MDWIIGLLLLIVGGIIGFFVAKFVLENKNAQQASQAKEQTIKEIMAQQASTHLRESRVVVNALQQQCDNLREQLDAYEGLLQEDTQSDGANKLNFFGEHAAVYIRNTQNVQKPKREPSEFQPQDFSSESSGLFDGSKNQQVIDSKQ